MGCYYNPPTDLKAKGRPLYGEKTYADLKKQLKPGERLFGLWYRTYHGFYNAPHLYCEQELKEFQKQEGPIHGLVLHGYYAVPLAEAQQGCGRGTTIREQE